MALSSHASYLNPIGNLPYAALMAAFIYRYTYE
jgi:hypothetical protein